MPPWYAIRTATAALAAAICLAGCSLNLLPSFGGAGSPTDIDIVQRAVATNPDNAHAWFLLGEEHLKAGEHEEAEDAFDRALALQPGFVEAVYGLGLAELGQGDFDEAEESFNAVIAADGEHVAAWEGLAVVRLERENLAGAAIAAEKALQLHPQSFRGLRILGEIAYIEGRYAQALDTWEQALALRADPTLQPIVTDLRSYLRKYGATETASGMQP